MVVLLPFMFEAVAPASARPELRLFQIDRLGSSIDRRLYSLGEIAAIRKARSNIGDLAAAMEDKLSALFLLCLVPMFLTVEVSAQVRSISAPRNTSHDRDPVSMISPGANAFSGSLIDAIHHDRAGIDVGARRPGMPGLKNKAVLRRLRRRTLRPGRVTSKEQSAG